jgi:hypothetical protein
MRVRAPSRDDAAELWLAPSVEYDVLEITIDTESKDVSVRTETETEGRIPALTPLHRVEITDPTIPPGWALLQVSDSFLVFGSLVWQEPGFWEAYFEGERWAVDRYEQNRSGLGS